MTLALLGYVACITLFVIALLVAVLGLVSELAAIRRERRIERRRPLGTVIEFPPATRRR